LIAAPEFDALLAREGFAGGYEFTEEPLQGRARCRRGLHRRLVSMGKEEERRIVFRVMSPFAVTPRLFAAAKPEAFFHALPAGHAGQEVTQEILDSPRSIIFESGGKPPAHAEGDSRDAGYFG